MEILLGILIGAALVVAVLFIISRKAAAKLPGVDPTQLTFDPAAMEEARALAATGQKLQAIKHLRDTHPGLSLAMAKSIVDRLDVQTKRPRANATQDQLPSASVVPFETELEARSLKAGGSAIEAIKVVRAATGWGLKESKDFVDRL